MAKRTSISAQESMEAMDLEGDPDITSALLTTTTEQPSAEKKRQVTVRFRGTKAAFGESRFCQAHVTEAFMQCFSPLNEILVKGNPYVEFLDAPSSSSTNANIPDEDNGEYRKPPAVLSMTLSAYAKDWQGHKKFPEKLLASLDPGTMSVNCALDLWLWVEVQKYFTLVTPPTHDASVLQLLDIGIGAQTKAWYTSLEDEELAMTDCDESSAAAEQPIDLNDTIEQVKKSIQRIQQSPKDIGNPSFEDVVRVLKLRPAKGDDVLGEAIQQMERALLQNNLRTNAGIMNLRKRHIDVAGFWQEQEKTSRDNMLDGMAMKRLMKLNKKQKMSKRFAAGDNKTTSSELLETSS